MSLAFSLKKVFRPPERGGLRPLAKQIVFSENLKG
jgi:hypothetical protein